MKHSIKRLAFAALLLLTTSTPALRAVDPTPAGSGGIILEDFNNIAGWKASDETSFGIPVFKSLTPGPVSGSGALELTTPGLIYTKLPDAKVPADAASATGLSFWVKGDGSDNYGCIALSGKAKPPLQGGAYSHEIEYVYYFPLKDKNWRQETVGWAEFKTERNDRLTFKRKEPTGYGTTINAGEGLKASEIRTIRLGSRFNMSYRTPGPLTYGIGPIALVSGAIPAKAAEAKRPKYIFKHPGLMLGKEDLELIKSEVNNTDPNPSESVRLRKLAWEEMMNAKGCKLIETLPDGSQTSKWFKLSDLDYPHHAQAIAQTDGGVSANMCTDAWAAYCHALQWVVKGDQRNADKAIEILNAWSSTLQEVGTTGDHRELATGWYTQRFCEAAELLRYSNSGWKEADIERFEGMLKNILLPHIQRHYFYTGWNWDMSFLNSIVAMGVFCNDEDIFNLGINFYYTSGTMGMRPSGQTAETLRDFGHAQMSLGELLDTCEIAWHQGVDLYSEVPDPETGLPRLAKSMEYMATLENEKEVTAVDDAGKMGVKGAEVKIRGSKTTKGWAVDEPPVYACMIQPIYEVAWNHYANRMGLGDKMPNVQELLNSQNVWWLGRATPGKAYRPEPNRENGMFGWGTLTHSNLSKPEKATATAK